MFHLRATLVNRASPPIAINTGERCQQLQMQGSSEAMNPHSKNAISALHWLFRLRK
jgi:hypothetical protein